MKSVQFLGLTIFALVTIVSCLPPKPAEFIAQNEDLTDYSKWTLVDKVSGNSDSLKGAHLADNPNTTRTIYIKNNADRTDKGKFPIGTILVKRYTDKDNKILGGVAMVKRGNSFNKAYGDWEFFVLDPTASKIAVNANGEQIRGALAKCNECHAVAAEDDYVFTR